MGDEVKDVMQREKQLDIARDMAGLPPKPVEKESVALVPMNDWQITKDQAVKAFKSGLFPHINTPEQMAVIIQTGKELGLGAMESLRGINLIQGKIALSSEAMLGLFLKRVKGARVKWLTPKEKEEKECEAEFSRDGAEPQKFHFDEGDAKRAGLLTKSNWQKYPKAQYRARTISAAIRAYAPDALLGAYTEEELVDVRHE